MLMAVILAAAPVSDAEWQGDVRASVQAVLPHAMTSFAARCRDRLPEGAYLTRNAPRLAARLQPAADAARPRALKAAVRYGLLRAEPGESDAGKAARLLALFDAKVVGTTVAPPQCAAISDLLQPLEPLPPENLAAFIAQVAMTLFLGKTPHREPSH